MVIEEIDFGRLIKLLKNKKGFPSIKSVGVSLGQMGLQLTGNECKEVTQVLEDTGILKVRRQDGVVTHFRWKGGTPHVKNGVWVSIFYPKKEGTRVIWVKK